MPLVSSLLDAGVVGHVGAVQNLGSENAFLFGHFHLLQQPFELYELCCRFHLKMLLCENADYLNHRINFHDLLKKMDLTICFQKGQIGSYGNDYDDGGAFEKGLSQKMDHGGQKMI